MTRRRSRNRLRIKVDENVSQKLKAEQVALRGPSIARALHEGVQMIQREAQANAPVDTGQMKRGVYVASIIGNEYRPLVRRRNGQRLNSPLKFPPRPNQALVVASVFYTRFVEFGRTVRTQNAGHGAKRKWRAVGRMKKRPFFQNAKRKMRRAAEVHVQRRLVQLIERTWNNG